MLIRELKIEDSFWATENEWVMFKTSSLQLICAAYVQLLILQTEVNKFSEGLTHLNIFQHTDWLKSFILSDYSLWALWVQWSLKAVKIRKYSDIVANWIKPIAFVRLSLNSYWWDELFFVMRYREDLWTTTASLFWFLFIKHKVRYRCCSLNNLLHLFTAISLSAALTLTLELFPPRMLCR